MGDYVVKLLKKENVILDNKVLLTVLKPVYQYRIKIRKDLFNAQKVPESSIKNILRKAVGESAIASCDYALITDDSGKVEILIPLSARALQYASILSPRPALLKGVQVLKRQEYVELEANAVFSRSLLNVDVPLGNLGNVYVYEGDIGVSNGIGNVVAVRIITDKGTRVVLSNELSRRFEAPQPASESAKESPSKARSRTSAARRSKRRSKRRKRKSRKSKRGRRRKKR